MKYTTLFFVLFTFFVNANSALAIERSPRRLMSIDDIREGRETLPSSLKHQVLYEFDCPAGGSIEVLDGEDTIEIICGSSESKIRLPGGTSWKDEFRLQASLLAGGQLNGGHVTSAQLAFSWFPGGGTNGLRFFGGVGHSFAPFHFMYGLAYEHMPKRKHWSLSLGLASQNMKSEDYRLDSTGLDIPFDLRFKFSDPFSLVFQGHFGVTWNEEGVMSELVSGMVGLGIDFW